MKSGTGHQRRTDTLGDGARCPLRLQLRPILCTAAKCREVPKPAVSRCSNMSCAERQSYSITSSASASSLSGTVRPSVLAVWWLITSSIFDTCITGKSAGRAPLRMRPT
jgi:hypothetical protein